MTTQKSIVAGKGNDRRRITLRAATFLLLCFFASVLAGCGKQDSTDSVEHAYVASPQLEEVVLRDRVAAVYSKVGFVKNGDRVRVLDRSGNKRFVRVRTEDAKEGWIEQRYLIGQDVYDRFKKLSQDNAKAPAQATAVVPRPLNLHVEPSRNSETLYQLKEGAKVELLKRTSTPKGGPAASPSKVTPGPQPKSQPPQPGRPGSENKKTSGRPAPAKEKIAVKKDAQKMQAPPPDTMLEDWWLVRDVEKRVGWLRGRTLDIEVPLEIAQYAEGQRIVGSFVLNTVQNEEGRSVSQYAVLMTEPKDGLPFDFNQLRIFTWNRKRSRYETAYRERFEGELPFTVGKEDFGKEGVLPAFTARFRDSAGNLQGRKYKMNGVLVRRITAPGDVPPPTTTRKGKAKAKRHNK